jgi:hypothetical protein
MEVRELPADQERLARPGRLLRRQDERPGARHGDAARLLADAGQREDAARQLLYPAQVGGLLVQLGVRVGRRGARTLADAHR